MNIFLYEQDKDIGEIIKYYLTEHLNNKVTLVKEEDKALALAGAFSFDKYILYHSLYSNLDKFLSLLPKDKIIISTTFFEDLFDYNGYVTLFKPFEITELDNALSKH